MTYRPLVEKARDVFDNSLNVESGRSKQKTVFIAVFILLLINFSFTSMYITYFTRGEDNTRAAYEISSSELVSHYSEVPPSMDDVHDPVWEEIRDITGSIPSHAETKSTNVYMQSIFTDTDVYIKLSWKDYVKNTDNNYWVYEEGNWTPIYNYQDGISLYFPVNDPKNLFEEEGCWRTCHARDVEYMNPENQHRKFTHTKYETGDLWFWDAGLTDPYNYTIDGYLTDVPSENNVGYYLDDDEDFGLTKNRPLVDIREFWWLANPVFMQNPDLPPSYNNEYIKSGEEVPFDEDYYDPDSGTSGINPITHEPWKNGDKVPAYMVDHLPTGEGDIGTSSEYNPSSQTWTVVMRRSLTTSREDIDVQFKDLTKEYPFGISVFGDLTGSSGTGNNNDDVEKTRCTSDKITTDILKLKFQSMITARKLENDPLKNSFNNKNNESMNNRINNIMENPIWNSVSSLTEPTYAYENKILFNDKIGNFTIKSVYTDEDIYLRLDWSEEMKSEIANLEIGWQIPEQISMEFKYRQFKITNNHLSTESKSGGDIWFHIQNNHKDIGNITDYHCKDGNPTIDSENSRNDVKYCSNGINSVVFKRELLNNRDDDLQFQDLTRAFGFSILAKGIGTEDFSISRTLYLKFEKDEEEVRTLEKVNRLTAVDGKDSNVFLQWDGVNISNFACYKIYHDTNNDQRNMDLLTKVSNKSITSFEIKGLKPNKKHYFAVTILDDNRNEGDFEKTVEVVPSDVTSPPKISRLRAMAGLDSNVFLEWNVTTIQDFKSYRIYSSSTPLTDIDGLEPIKEIKSKNFNQFEVQGLLKDEKYYFAVTTVDWSENENSKVSCVSSIVKDQTPPPKVDRLNAFDLSSEKGGMIGLRWEKCPAKDVDTYLIYMSNNEDIDILQMDPVKEVNNTSVKFENLENNKTYYFSVVSVDWNGHISEVSHIVSAKPSKSAPPEPLEYLNAKDVKDGKVLLEWSPSTSEDFHHYCIYVSDMEITSFNSSFAKLIANISSREKCSLNISGLENGKQYFFAITVANIHNKQNKTEIITAQVAPTATEPPGESILKIITPYIITIIIIAFLIYISFFSITRYKRFGSIKKRRLKK